MPRKTKAQREAERPHIIVEGNPFDGFKYTGPFLTHAEASEYADRHDAEWDWWIVPLQTPATN